MFYYWLLIETYYICFIKKTIFDTAANPLSAQALRREVRTLQVAADQRVTQLSHHIREEKKLATANRTLTKENEVLAKDVLKAYTTNRKLQQKNEQQHTQIEELQEALRIARLPRNSSNSSRPPSTDLYKPARNTNNSLREKTGKKTGGQPLGMPVRHYCLTLWLLIGLSSTLLTSVKHAGLIYRSRTWCAKRSVK